MGTMVQGRRTGTVQEDDPAHSVDRIGSENAYFGPSTAGIAPPIMLPIVKTPPPTPREVEEARRRELARLDLRLDSVTGRAFHTPGDAELLKGDTADKRWSDTDVVRRWAAGSDERDARTGRTERPRARRDRVGGRGTVRRFSEQKAYGYISPDGEVGEGLRPLRGRGGQLVQEPGGRR